MPYRPFNPAIAARKQKNAEIFRETTRYIQAGGYTTPSGREVQFDFTTMLQGEKCFQSELPAASSPAAEGETEVLVECNDCLVAAERLVKEGYNPVLLNFASAGHIMEKAGKRWDAYLELRKEEERIRESSTDMAEKRATC